MRVVRAFVFALASLAALASSSGARADPVRFTFYDCGGSADCSNGTSTVLAQFVTSGPLLAPAVPAPGTLSAAAPIDVMQVLAGSWDSVGLVSFNVGGFIGSEFVFQSLLPANGHDYGALIAFGAATAQALRLQWDVGTYNGFGVVQCLNSGCTQTTTIRAFGQLVVDPWEQALPLPEPASVPLVLAALALAGAAIGRRCSRGGHRQTAGS